MAELGGDERALPKVEQIPVCDDARTYLKILRSTDEYKGIIEKMHQGQKVPEGETTLSKEEVIEVFEEQEKFKALFWDFYGHVIHLEYKEADYPVEFREAFEDYKVKALDSIHAAYSGKDKQIVRFKDRVRSEAHDKAAKLLAAGDFAPNEFVGRILTRAFLVDVGHDVVDSARKADMYRVLRHLGDDEKSIKATEKKFIYIGKRFFSGDQVKDIQEKFKENHDGTAVVGTKRFTLEGNQFMRSILGGK